MRIPKEGDIRFGSEVLSDDILEYSFPLVRAEDGVQRNLGTLTLISDLREERQKILLDGSIAFFGHALVLFLISIILSGFELALDLLALRADLPVLMTTGYLRGKDEARVREIGIRELLLKPVSTDHIGQVLDPLFAGSHPAVCGRHLPSG